MIEQLRKRQRRRVTIIGVMVHDKDAAAWAGKVIVQDRSGRKSKPALVLLLLIHALALPTAAPAGESAPSRYTTVSASADGIGKVYLGREIAQVMSFHGAQWLERAERVDEERPELVLAALELRPGMTVADIGAGTGYYSWRMAQRVGASGTVYAVDIQPEMIKLLERQMSRRGAANVKPVLGELTDPGLPPGSIDLALMVDVYHEFEYPYEMLTAIVRALKPGGRLVFVEFRGGDAAVPIKPLHTMTEAQVRKEAAIHALEWVKTARDLPWQNAIVFRKLSGN
jgi:ubiquinone/menaquinone biosynthesis C-methylase UbiE